MSDCNGWKIQDFQSLLNNNKIAKNNFNFLDVFYGFRQS